jgi:hypothetical protein
VTRTSIRENSVDLKTWLTVLGVLFLLCAGTLALIGSPYAATISYIGVALGLIANVAPSDVHMQVFLFFNCELNQSGLYACYAFRFATIVKDDEDRIHNNSIT